MTKRIVSLAVTAAAASAFLLPAAPANACVAGQCLPISYCLIDSTIYVCV